MKNIGRIFLLCVFLLLSACALPRISSLQPTALFTPTPSATITLTPSATLTLSVTPSLTVTASPSLSATVLLTASTPPIDAKTRAPSETPRNTRTPVPSPLTPLPTFDRTKIVTVTPGPHAVCPVENPAVAASFPKNQYIEPEEILAYANAGLEILDEQANLLNGHGKVIDLTGDGVKELILSQVHYSFYRCINGVYEKIPFEMGVEGQFSADLEEIEDVNQNGIPEIFFASFERHGEVSVFIYEWDGNIFRSLISVQEDVLNPIPNDFVLTESKYDIVDTNGDGLKEIVMVDDIGAYEHVEGMPFRRQIIILSWDGTHYVNLRPANFGPPQFRFQAVQDADRQVILGNYAQAMALYQQVISSDTLDWWSSERDAYTFRTQSYAEVLPTPYKDPEEREALSAYATYRRVVLHVYLGQMDEAQTEYDRLRQEIQAGHTAYHYLEMTRIFLDSYQASQNFQNACVDVVAYVDKNDQVFSPLGFGDHWPSDHRYTAEDLCPLMPNR